MIALVGGIVVLVAIVAIVLLTRDSEDEGGGDQTASACKPAQGPEANLPTSVEPPSDGEVLEEGDAATALVTTSLGEFTIELDTDQAPITANSFAYLAEEGFYDGLVFHRIAPGFVIQGGDPQGNGTGGPGYSCEEAPPQGTQYTKGVVAMAKSGPEPAGTSGSQFFVVTGPSAPLPPDYAIVGEVTEGIDVVEEIGKLGTPAEQPTREVTIESIEIEEG
jgi:peptidyl-prolyl cis-trans isomerase B (cyclophilin B)